VGQYVKIRHNFGNILITGGCGFIGYNLVAEIIRNHDYENIQIFDEKGYLPFYDPLRLHTNKKVRFIRGSVMERDAFDQCLKSDYIVHAAGFLGIQNVANESSKTLDVNILGTRNCLEYAARQKNIKKFLIFSTSEIYGSHTDKFCEEGSAVIQTTGERWCYAASKLAAEQYTLAFSREKNIPYTIVRPFNVYGPYRLGSNAMTTFIERALSGENILISGDGTQKRAWCHVNDFINGAIRATIFPSGVNEAFNIGNPFGECSIFELAEFIIQLSGSSSRIIVTQAHTEDILARSPNINKARKILGFNPSINLKDGIRDNINWIISEKRRRTNDRKVSFVSHGEILA